MEAALKPPKRFITGHNAEGKAVFSDAMPEETQPKKIGKDATFVLGYATDAFPADLNADKDLKSYREFESQPPGLVVNSGTVSFSRTEASH